MRIELTEVRESIDKVCTRVDGMQGSVDRAFAPLAEAVDRHESTLAEHDEHIKALDMRIEAQAPAMEALWVEVLALRSAQDVAEESVKEARREMAMPPDAPPPPLPRAASGWDRVVEPNILQANAGAFFSSEALVASLTPR